MAQFESKSAYDAWFDRMFAKLTKGVEDHQFQHYNSSMGIHIYGKEHYKEEMKKRRMISYDFMEQYAEQYDKEHPRKEYGELSPKAMDVIRSIKSSADEKGNIKLGSVAVNALIDIGAIKPQSPYIPEFDGKGGFSQ